MTHQHEPPSIEPERRRASADEDLWAPPGADGDSYEGDFPEPPLDDPGFQGSFFEATFQTVKRCLLSPAAFFAGMREGRSAAPALVLALLLICISALLRALLNSAFGMDPMDAYRQIFEQLQVDVDMQSFESFAAMGMVFGMLLIPIFAAIQLLLYILIYYASAKVWGCFERDFTLFMRAASYAHMPLIFLIILPISWIPIVDDLYYFLIGCIQLLWMGFAMVYAGKGTTGRTIGAVLTPTVLCCFCMIGFIVVAVAALASSASGM